MLSRTPTIAVSLTLALSAVVASALTVAQEPDDAPDLVMYGRIRDEGQTRSQVMRYASELMDGIGARLTGSPNLEEATEWAVNRLKQMGLSNVRTESWGEFGMGWRQRNVWVRMIDPDIATFVAVAAPWSPPTNGVVTAEVVALRGFVSESEFEPLRGKLRGKVVLLGQAPGPPDIIPIERPLFQRLDEKQLAEHARPEIESGDTGGRDNEAAFARIELAKSAGRFLASEGVRAVIVPSGDRPTGGISGGTLWADGNAGFGWFAYRKEHAMHVPLVIVANEHYGRMRRLLEQGVAVTLELNVDTEFTGDREDGHNVFGEIAGVDSARKHELILVAAHLDSWSAGTGATDDGAGVVIAMEAMRILNALQVKPRRTIRIALWTGEEQGALGSLDYVKRHVAAIPRANTAAQLRVPEFIREITGPIAPKSEHARLSAVFNIDAGGGRIRGVSVGNSALVPIFERWIAPLHDMGMTMVSSRSDCGGDCRPFADAGIPTPIFKQDPLDYSTRTHHTNMDTYEHLPPEDMRQAATIMATLVYNAATRDRMLPRTR